MAMFWKEIIKMSVIPAVLIFCSMLIIHYTFPLDSWSKLIFGIIMYSIVYIPLFFRLSLTDDERNLVSLIFKKLLRLA